MHFGLNYAFKALGHAENRVNCITPMRALGSTVPKGDVLFLLALC